MAAPAARCGVLGAEKISIKGCTGPSAQLVNGVFTRVYGALRDGAPEYVKTVGGIQPARGLGLYLEDPPKRPDGRAINVNSELVLTRHKAIAMHNKAHEGYEIRMRYNFIDRQWQIILQQASKSAEHSAAVAPGFVESTIEDFVVSGGSKTEYNGVYRPDGQSDSVTRYRRWCDGEKQQQTMNRSHGSWYICLNHSGTSGYTITSGSDFPPEYGWGRGGPRVQRGSSAGSSGVTASSAIADPVAILAFVDSDASAPELIPSSESWVARVNPQFHGMSATGVEMVVPPPEVLPSAAPPPNPAADRLVEMGFSRRRVVAALASADSEDAALDILLTGDFESDADNSGDEFQEKHVDESLSPSNAHAGPARCEDATDGDPDRVIEVPSLTVGVVGPEVVTVCSKVSVNGNEEDTFPASDDTVCFGTYVQTAEQSGGRPVYMQVDGEGECCIRYSSDEASWRILHRESVVANAKSFAATPDHVIQDKWKWSGHDGDRPMIMIDSKEQTTVEVDTSINWTWGSSGGTSGPNRREKSSLTRTADGLTVSKTKSSPDYSIACGSDTFIPGARGIHTWVMKIGDRIDGIWLGVCSLDVKVGACIQQNK